MGNLAGNVAEAATGNKPSKISRGGITISPRLLRWVSISRGLLAGYRVPLGICVLPLLACLGFAACSDVDPNRESASDPSDSKTQEPLDRQILEVAGSHGGIEFTARLYPALADESRRDFDDQAWMRKWGAAGTLYLLRISVDSDAAGALDLGALVLGDRRVEGESHFSFVDPGEFSTDPVVRDPLAVLLSKPDAALEPGGSLSASLLGPKQLTDPFLRLGAQLFALVPADAKSARLPKDLPLLHVAPEESR